MALVACGDAQLNGVSFMLRYSPNGNFVASINVAFLPFQPGRVPPQVLFLIDTEEFAFHIRLGYDMNDDTITFDWHDQDRLELINEFNDQHIAGLNLGRTALRQAAWLDGPARLVLDLGDPGNVIALPANHLYPAIVCAR
ncbi:hypothetical protein FOL47_009525 [Perkinsus chesapeaki]|uniref:Uncharacterized protein n=1 Tax=Perkinsus chesapeaki TaxID=330153 RepID=A0A7J6MRP5_PERCH|nr:hypothetical protein FOL47_009525 [Perkinsus chesapeaki]